MRCVSPTSGTPSSREREQSVEYYFKAESLVMKTPSLPKLGDVAYDVRASVIGDAVKSVGFWGYVTGETNCPDVEDTRAYGTHTREAAAVRRVIMGTIND